MFDIFFFGKGNVQIRKRRYIKRRRVFFVFVVLFLGQQKVLVFFQKKWIRLGLDFQRKGTQMFFNHEQYVPLNFVFFQIFPVEQWTFFNNFPKSASRRPHVPLFRSILYICNVIIVWRKQSFGRTVRFRETNIMVRPSP